MFTSVCAANILFTSSPAPISKEKKATGKGLLLFIAAFMAKFKQKAVLPTAGLAATTIKAFFCQPDVSLSNSWKPVGTPVTSSFLFFASSISFTVFTKTSLREVKFLRRCLSVISYSLVSAVSNKSKTSVDASYALPIISLEFLINSRIMNFSMIMRA